MSTTASRSKLLALATLLPGNRHFVIAVLTVAVCSIYVNSLNVPFIFDDHTYIADNPAVKDLRKVLSPAALEVDDIDVDVANNVRTRPLSYLSFGINYALHGFDVRGYHVLNIALHVGNSVLLYLLLSALTRQMLGVRNSDDEDGQRGVSIGHALAFASALLFAVHPVQTNVVTYLTQRMASIATFWYLLSALLFVVWRKRCNRGWLLYAGALAASAAGMFSKEICFTLPVMLVIIEMLFFRASPGARLGMLTPFLATMAIIPIQIARIVAPSAETLPSVLVNSVNLANPGGTISPYHYFVTQLRVIVTYLRILVFPHDLHLDRYFPQYSSFGQPEVFWSGILLLLLALGAVYLIRRSREHRGTTFLCMRMVAFGIIWFFLALSVESSFIPINSAIFEYRLYLPSIGFFCAVSYGFGGLLVAQRNLISHRNVLTFSSLAVTVIAIFATITLARNRTWQDAEFFWRDAITKSPKYGNYVSLAHVLRDKGKVGEAMDVLREQAERNPELVHPIYEMGLLCLDTGDPEQAIEYLFRALARRPDRPEIYRELSIALLTAGNLNGAVTLYRRARMMFPDIRAVRELDAHL